MDLGCLGLLITSRQTPYGTPVTGSHADMCTSCAIFAHLVKPGRHSIDAHDYSTSTKYKSFTWRCRSIPHWTSYTTAASPGSVDMDGLSGFSERDTGLCSVLPGLE
jgi:hypothetical protein